MASLYFKYAAMNSGKTTQLLQAHYNYTERGMNPMAMCPSIDDRYGEGNIGARIGLKLKAETFGADTDLFDAFMDKHTLKPVDIFLIDEAQFLTREQVGQLARIVDQMNVPVIAFGLKTDFMGKLFEGSEALMCLADNLEEIKTICHCGRKAIMTARFNENGEIVRDGEQIEIGDNDRYIALCRAHFKQGKLSSQDEETLEFRLAV